MLPQTVEKLRELVNAGATVIGNAPLGLATLSGGDEAQQRFDEAVGELFSTNYTNGTNKSDQDVRDIRDIRGRKGRVLSGMTIDEALKALNLLPDVRGGNALWSHRQTKGADWYFVTSPKGGSFSGDLDFRNTGNNVELWDPVTGEITPAIAKRNGDRTTVTLDLPEAGACFVVFRKNGKTLPTAGSTLTAHNSSLITQWTLAFPSGWDAPASLPITELKAWKDLDLSPEAKAFSGTVVYTTAFDADKVTPDMRFTLDLGRVEMIAAVSLNGKPLRTLWAPPYRLDITGAIQQGENTLTVEVTSSWFNRLVYDAGLPENERKTWTIRGPNKDAPLRESGLLGPVTLIQ
jgi:hypothetical protein